MTSGLRSGAWRRWQAAAGPWSLWSVCLPLMVPDTGVPLMPPTRPRLAHVPLDSTVSTLVLLDLTPVTGIHLAQRLWQSGRARPILLLRRWPYLEAVLPCGPLIAALLACAPGAPPPDEPPHAAVVLDGDRARPLHSRPARDPRADNRWSLSPADLPSTADLQRRGVERVLYLAPAARPPDRVLETEVFPPWSAGSIQVQRSLVP